MLPSWNDADLAVASDSPRMAGYRLLQSHWRESVLGLPAGCTGSGKLVGSLLAEDAPADAQWLTQPIADYVRARVPAARQQGEKIAGNRLRRNLLSSQPLCFNIFGELAACPEAAARVLSRVLDVQVDRIDDVVVEHAPVDAKRKLADHSAFDAYIAFSNSDGRCFFGIETKYTERFSPKEYTRDTYIAATDDPTGWFLPGSTDAAKSTVTNQLWRTALLAQLTEQAGAPLTGYVVVLCAADDATATAAVAGLRALMREPDVKLRQVTFDRLVAEAAKEPELQAWASLFASRYLAAPV